MADRVERSFSEVFQDIAAKLQHMIRAELQLARTEIVEEGAKAVNGGKMMVTGGVLGLYALGFLLLTAATALATVVALWLANLIVAVVVGLIALITLIVARNRMKQVHPTPDKTIRTVKENVEWVKDQTR